MQKLTLSCLLFLLFVSFYNSAYAADTLIFVIRVDDILSRNTTILPRSILPFQQAVELRQAKISWAVIPHRLIESPNQDGKICSELLASQANDHEITQHGYNHICPFCGQYHEFYCTTQNKAMSYKLQDSLIAAGKNILFDSLGIQPQTFVPPSHVADNTTYQVLLDRGFRWISTDGPLMQDIYPGLYNLNAGIGIDYNWALTTDKYKSKLVNALQDIETQKRIHGFFCILLHDYFIRQGYEKGLVIQWMGELLDSLDNRHGHRIRYMTLNQAGEYFKRNRSLISSSILTAMPEFYLKPNYPNPFNSHTMIRYQLLKPGMITLNIYNANRQIVETLIDRRQVAGEYAVCWHPENYNLSSGSYLYRIIVNGTIAVQKYLFIK